MRRLLENAAREFMMHYVDEWHVEFTLHETHFENSIISYTYRNSIWNPSLTIRIDLRVINREEWRLLELTLILRSATPMNAKMAGMIRVILLLYLLLNGTDWLHVKEAGCWLPHAKQCRWTQTLGEGEGEGEGEEKKIKKKKAFKADSGCSWLRVWP